MPETPEGIAYAESIRAIEFQARALDELRSRTGLLLAGASVVTSFLGAEALREEGLDTLAAFAVVAFLAVVGLCLWIVTPPRKKDARFVMSARILLEDWADEPRGGDVAAMQRFLAETIDRNYDHNETRLGQLYAGFRAAAWLLGLDVLLWTIDLT